MGDFCVILSPLFPAPFIECSLPSYGLPEAPNRQQKSRESGPSFEKTHTKIIDKI
jgi:hypothetical protein